jgi:hypothetical protein
MSLGAQEASAQARRLAPGAARRPAPTRFVGSYETAMNIPVSYDFSGATPGLEGLGRADLNAPLQAALPRFTRCVAQEQARGATLSAVQLRLVIASDGRLLGASVDHGSTAFRQCALQVSRSLRWRTFSGPRIGLTWGFSVE